MWEDKKTVPMRLKTSKEKAGKVRARNI